MLYQEFKNDFFELACFSGHQVSAWRGKFDKNNLGRWVQQGLLLRLKPGLYCFPEYLGKPGFEFYVANRMYRPSYISLHSALAFYGMIPEAVVQVTSVSSLKTADFTNRFGQFSYQSMKPEYLFGYVSVKLTDGRDILLADPEKALLDLLYLFPFYNSKTEMTELRLDEDFIRENLNEEKLWQYSSQFNIGTLEKRVRLFLKAYSR